MFDREIPESHWLALPGDDPEKAKEAGFKAVKLKIGRDLFGEISELTRWHEAGVSLRVDGNEMLSLSTFLEFWEELGIVSKYVEFVEDPVLWDPDTWRILREMGIGVAVDREVESRWEEGSLAVLKPAVTSWTPPASGQLLVTSYMDHAVGQLWAAYEATRLEKEHAQQFRGAGLFTHRCFESDPFFERIASSGARLLAPTGTGLGFDDLLENLPWKALT